MATEPEVLIRLGRIEALVEHLYRHFGIPEPDFSDSVSDEVRDLVRQNKAIQAIQLHRQQTGKSLAEAKSDVDALME